MHVRPTKSVLLSALANCMRTYKLRQQYANCQHILVKHAKALQIAGRDAAPSKYRVTIRGGVLRFLCVLFKPPLWSLFFQLANEPFGQAFLHVDSFVGQRFDSGSDPARFGNFHCRIVSDLEREAIA